MNQKVIVNQGQPPDNLIEDELLVLRSFIYPPSIWVHVWRRSISGSWVDSNNEVVPTGRIEAWMHVPTKE